MTSDDTPIRETDQIRQDCAKKPVSSRSATTSRRSWAACSVEKGRRPGWSRWSSRRGHLLGRCDGEAGFKAFLGASDDLIRNKHGVAPVAELDGDEVGFLVAKVAEIKRQR